MSLSIVKVAPDVGQGQETRIEKEDKKAKPSLSISFASDGNHSIEDSNISAGKSPTKLMSSGSKTNESQSPTKSQRQRNYNNKRFKSSESFFKSRSDVFEIDGHAERLSNQIQKNHRSQSKKTNKWNAKRAPLKRFFKCSCVLAPSVFSADEICVYAKVGDLLLFREGASFEQRYLSPEVMRGIKSSLDGKYIPKVRQIKMWNRIGIVVSLYDDETDDYTKYILYADDIGLRLRKLSEVTNSCVIAKDLCSLRPVNIKNSKQQHLYSTFVDDLESVALLAQNGKLLWSNFERAERCQGADRSTIDDDTLLILDHPHVSRFHKTFTERMQKLSFSPSQEGIREATRLFHSMLAVNHVNEKAGDSSSSSSAIQSLNKLASFGKSGDNDTLPLELIFKSLSVMNDDEGKSKQGDHEFAMRLRNMLGNMDEDKDGHVSLVSFTPVCHFCCSSTLSDRCLLDWIVLCSVFCMLCVLNILHVCYC
jgi:hypothetical protein